MIKIRGGIIILKKWQINRIIGFVITMMISVMIFTSLANAHTKPKPKLKNKNTKINLVKLNQPNVKIEIRKFPKTYRNMLTILSDADLMQMTEFEGIHKFLNTTSDNGNLGRGLGLDLGDTFFMESLYYQKDNSLEPKDYIDGTVKNIYWWGDTNRDISGEKIRKYIKAGWIDTPHTFADGFSLLGSGWSVNKTKSIFNEWARIGFRPITWVDHMNMGFNVNFFNECYLVDDVSAGEVTIKIDKRLSINQVVTFDYTFEQKNVIKVTGNGPYVVTLDSPIRNNYKKDWFIHGAWLGNQQLGLLAGGLPTSEYYHIDQSINYGIKAYWAKIPDNIGKNTNWGASGFESTLIPQRLLNNVKVWGLLRYYEYGQTNNTSLGACISRALYGDSIGGPIKPETYHIITTHWGYGDRDGAIDNKYIAYDDVYKLNNGRWFNKETELALRDLKAKQDKGEILVTSTQKLVSYNLAQDMLSKYAFTNSGFTIDNDKGIVKIIIHKINDDIFGGFIPTLEDLRGITFYCENPEKTQIWIGKKKVPKEELIITPPDYTGKYSIGIKWYDIDTKDYTLN